MRIASSLDLCPKLIGIDHPTKRSCVLHVVLLQRIKKIELLLQRTEKIEVLLRRIRRSKCCCTRLKLLSSGEDEYSVMFKMMFQ